MHTCWPYSQNPVAQLFPDPAWDVIDSPESKISPIAEEWEELTTDSSISTKTARAFKLEIGEPTFDQDSWYSPFLRNSITCLIENNKDFI